MAPEAIDQLLAWAEARLREEQEENPFHPSELYPDEGEQEECDCGCCGRCWNRPARTRMRAEP